MRKTFIWCGANPWNGYRVRNVITREFSVTQGKMSPNQKVKRQQEFVARKRLISRLKLKDKTNAVCSEQFNWREQQPVRVIDAKVSHAKGDNHARNFKDWRGKKLLLKSLHVWLYLKWNGNFFASEHAVTFISETVVNEAADRNSGKIKRRCRAELKKRGYPYPTFRSFTLVAADGVTAAVSGKGAIRRTLIACF